MHGTLGMREMLYSVECRQEFQRISPNILGNVLKDSRECYQKFRGVSSHILGNALKYSEECRQTLRGMLPSILGNVAKHSYVIINVIIKLFTVDKNVLHSFRQS